MKETYKNVNYELLTKPSGDPFVDAGGYALKRFSDLYPDLDILELVMKVTDIYVDRWDAKINHFFLNSKITQPAFKADKKKEETRKYFKSLLEETAPCKNGVCRILGVRTKLFPAGRDNSVLSGSGTFVNFHHCFQEGIMLSKECIIRYHFLPLACELLQGCVAVVHSSNNDVAAYFAENCCNRNISALAHDSSDGILKSNSKSPGTELFRYADDVIADVREMDAFDSCSITLYNFTNFGASPEVKIYTLPFETFKFYRFTQKAQFRDQWNSFVTKYYKTSDNRKTSYDETNNVFTSENKGCKDEITENEFKYWRNKIYDKLLQGESILKEILNRIRNCDFDFRIVEIYEINVRNMKKETIEKIKQMAEFIFKSNDENGIKKAIRKLDGVSSSYLLRRFVLKDVVAKYYNEGNDEAIVTIEDYADYLFPDTSSWMEMRDVLLIAIYQKLHENKMALNVELPEVDNEKV